MSTLIKWILGIIGAAVLFIGGIYLYDKRRIIGPPGDDGGIPWVTPDEAYENEMARTGMDGGAFVTRGLKIRDPRDICKEEEDYNPNRYALSNGGFETLQSGEKIYVRYDDGMQRRSTWVWDGKCIFVDESGCVAHDIYAFDGFWAGEDGVWDESLPRLEADTLPVSGRKYREAGNPTGQYLLFQMNEDGTGTVTRAYPSFDFSEKYDVSPFGRGTYALQSPTDEVLRAHLAILPDAQTAIMSQAGETVKYLLER